MFKPPVRYLSFGMLFLAVAIGYGYFLNQSANFSKYAHQIEENLRLQEKEVAQFFENKSFLGRQMSPSNNLSLNQIEDDFNYLKQLSRAPYSISVYREDSLVFWTNNQAFPPLEDIDRELPEQNRKLVKLKNGYYELVAQSFRDRDGFYSIFALLPIKHEYHLTSSYLKPIFEAGAHLSENLIVSREETDFPIFGKLGAPLFYLDAKGPVVRPLQLLIQAWLFAIGFILLGYFVHQYALKIKETKGAMFAGAFFLGCIFGVRLITLIAGFGDYFSSFPLFAPTFQTVLSKSLGDLLINIFLLLWVMYYFYRHSDQQDYSHLSRRQRLYFTVLNYASITIVVLFITFVFKTLVLQTSISYDFSNVFNLDRYSLFSIIGVIFLLAALFLFSYSNMKSIKNLGFNWNERMGILLAVLAVLWPVCYLFDLLFPPFFMVLIPLAFIFLFDLFVDHRQETFKWFVVWLITLAGFASILLFKYNAYKDRFTRLKYAIELVDLRDSIAENSFSKLKAKIAKDEFIQREVGKPFPFKVDKDQLYRQVDRYYTDDNYLFYNYKFKIHAFNKYNQPATRRPELSFEQLMDWQARGIPTEDKQIKYVNTDEGNNKYLLKVDVPVRGNPLQIFLEFERDKREASKVYTELLVDKQYKNLQWLDRYDYAVYRDKKRVDFEGKAYGPLLTLEDLPPAGASKEFIDRNRSDFLYHAPNGTIVIMGKDRESIIEWISLFSYIFGLLIILALIFAAVNTFIPLIPKGPSFRRNNNSSLANRIQLSIISLIVASFVIIGMVTVWFFRTSSEDYHEQRLERKTRSVLTDAIHEVEMMISQGDSLPELKQIVGPLSKIHRMDVNLYNLQGKLIASSEGDIFNKGIISPIMPALAYKALSMNKLSEFIQDPEKVGQLFYKAAYVPLINRNKRPIAYLGLPYYSKQRQLRSDVTSFMSTLINAYVFLLLLATGVAFGVAESITRPLVKLGRTLKKVRLDGTSQPLIWKSKDELGALIQEYNGMIQELEKSANALAQTEREGAWREMAKQVAHEIKNPLTPMRLSIQYLGMAYRSNPDNIGETLDRVTNTMLGQIDNLTQIANEFSNFAKMPRAKNRTFILNDLIGNVFNLFKHGDGEDMDMRIELPKDKFAVFADPNQLVSVFNNLLKNAIQAIPDDRDGRILVTVYRESEMVGVKVSDNGCGIPNDKKEKVFVPNFTTKSSGTGLGLAISKNIVESVNGDIYFRTIVGEGTDFHVRLPIVKASELETVL